MPTTYLLCMCFLKCYFKGTFCTKIYEISLRSNYYTLWDGQQWVKWIALLFQSSYSYKFITNQFGLIKTKTLKCYIYISKEQGGGRWWLGGLCTLNPITLLAPDQLTQGNTPVILLAQCCRPEWWLGLTLGQRDQCSLTSGILSACYTFPEDAA